MTNLFNRDFALTLGAVRISARPPGEPTVSKPTLRVVFKVERDTNRDPNKANVAVFNLAESSRSAIQTEAGLPVIIEAGYVDAIGQIFTGDLEYSGSVKDGTDWVTELESGDSSRKYRSARININAAAGALLADMLKQASESLGVGIGNALEKINAGNFRGGLTVFTKGLAFNGKSSALMDKLFTTAGLEWSIQDGQIQVGKPTDVLPGTAVVLSSDTGLIGAPEVGENGKLKARSLLQSTITPGRLIEMQAETIGGNFRVDKVVHFGDTFGQDWYSDLEAKPI